MKGYWIGLFGTMFNVIFVGFAFVVMSLIYVNGMEMKIVKNDLQGTFIIACITCGAVGLFYIFACAHYYFSVFWHRMEWYTGLKYGLILSLVSGLKYWLLVGSFACGMLIVTNQWPQWLSITCCSVLGVLYLINFILKMVLASDYGQFEPETDITGVYEQMSDHVKSSTKYENLRTEAAASLRNILQSSKY